MVISAGKPVAEVGRDLGIHDGILGNWVNAWRREHPEPDQPLSPVERARVKELEAEVPRLRMENEFLKRRRPSSRGRTRSRAVCGDRCGEGHLQDRLDVPAAGCAAFVVLCLAQPGRDRDGGPAARAGCAGQGSV
jgi:transposase